MGNCLFCKIVNKEIPTSFVAENGELVAFDDIRPKAPAHVLILPKAHVLSVKEADEKLSGKLITLARKIQRSKVLVGIRAKQYRARPKSDYKKKREALKRLAWQKKMERLRKLGKAE